MSRQAIYDRLRARLQKESGPAIPPPEGRVSVCMAYPNVYAVGMSSLGFLSVHAMLNERPDVSAERAFLPDPGELKEHLSTRTPVCSMESMRPLSEFDILAFSVSFENDYPNVLRMLRLSGIPARADERNEHHPLVVMGGVCAFSNPEPMADFMDAVFVGEAEEMLDAFIDRCGEEESRDALLSSAVFIGGVYVPSLYEIDYGPDGAIRGRRALRGAPGGVQRLYCEDISARPARQLITTPEAEFSDMRLVEVQRGCPWNCRFCLAGKVFNPPRKKTPEALGAEIGAAPKGCKVGLVGPSLGDYPGLSGLLGAEGVDFTITSLRASRASAELVLNMKKRGSVSIAPEAGTARLREHINKRVGHEDIIECAGMILRGGIKRLKLYFMVGLPTETEEDVRGIISLVSEIRSLTPRGRISLTLSPFVPKPFTDFEREPMERPSVLKARIRMVKEGLKGLGKGVGISHDPVRSALMQGLLAMGDRRVGAVIEGLAASGDSNYMGAAGSAGVDPVFYVHRQKPVDEVLPWDFILS